MPTINKVTGDIDTFNIPVLYTNIATTSVDGFHRYNDYFGLSPANLADLVIWLRADKGIYQDAAKTVPATADGDVVGAWVDQSGNGYDFTQATTAKKPTLQTAEINGLSSLRFDGADDILIHAANVSSATEGTIFVVAELNAGAVSNRTLFGTADDVSTAKYVTVAFSSSISGFDDYAIVAQRDAGGNNRIRGTTRTADDVFRIATFSSNGTSYGIRLDGADDGLTVISGADNGDWYTDVSSRDNFTVGGAKLTSELWFYLGDIVEVIAYDRDLTTSEKQQVESYLSGQYGISI